MCGVDFVESKSISTHDSKTSATKMPASFIPPFTWRLRMTDRCGGRGFVCNARMAETTEHFDAAEMRERMNRR
ncbi:hypothetical protein C7S16_5519 [Burkholderia thailandensis]|uniref:Uncharacterized protein n=1 Tax=Burkholderia thailandensis TaxID=57975 RepID=A0AAW9CQY7_BURTH|nr:hypothetical protein [Burkholderia thailandensis]